MNPTDIIFQSLSHLTGGLITDLTTAIVGMVLLSFIAMGFDLILDVLDSRMQFLAQRKKLTGLLVEPRVSGKLEMQSDRSSYEVSYGYRGVERKSVTGTNDFTHRPVSGPAYGSLCMERED